jgi:uncharacterized protein (DUF2141 family)
MNAPQGRAVRPSRDECSPARVVLLVLALLTFSRCATQRPPDGGPPDTEPPSIVETFPAHGTVRFTDTYVRFTWSEYVNRQSFESAVHVSPVPNGAITYSWSGTSVELRFPGPLAPDRTYVVTIGTGAKDVHGNAIRQTIQLAFATGDSLDTGTFSGTVFDERASGVSLFAYLLDGRSPDTLNPSTLKPDFMIQAGSDGRFVFRNVPRGGYRVFAVRDNQGNLLYDREADDIGIAQGDAFVGLLDTIGPSLRYRLNTEDSTAPYVQTVECTSNQRVSVKFSEALSVEAPAAAHISVIDSATAQRIPALAVVPVPGQRFRYDVFTASPLREAIYLFAIDSLFDAAGNPMSNKGARSFTGSAAPDSSRPRLIASYPLTKTADIRADSVFHMLFSMPMRTGAAISLKDSSGASIPCELSWPSLNRLDIAHPPLAHGAFHTLCIDGRSCLDTLRGDVLADSSICIAFTTERDDAFGELSGAVLDTTDALTASVVRAVSAERKGFSMTTRTAEKGRFAFPRIPAGKYTLDAFKDHDGAGKYDFGKAYPFRPSQRFGIRSDTVRVRAKWETKGVTIDVP